MAFQSPFFTIHCITLWTGALKGYIIKKQSNGRKSAVFVVAHLPSWVLNAIREKGNEEYCLHVTSTENLTFEIHFKEKADSLKIVVATE